MKHIIAFICVYLCASVDKISYFFTKDKIVKLAENVRGCPGKFPARELNSELSE